MLMQSARSPAPRTLSPRADASRPSRLTSHVPAVRARARGSHPRYERLSAMSPAPDLSDVQAAAARIAPFAHRTPVVRCATLDRLAGRQLFFKCEHLQKSGSFKFRGACNAVMKLPDEAAARGVVTHSSGNHAGALALAARLRGIPAHVVMPTSASPLKRRATLDYGAEVVDCAPTLQARETTAAAVLAADRRHADPALRPPRRHRRPGHRRPRAAGARCPTSTPSSPPSAAAACSRAPASPATPSPRGCASSPPSRRPSTTPPAPRPPAS